MGWRGLNRLHTWITSSGKLHERVHICTWYTNSSVVIHCCFLTQVAFPDASAYDLQFSIITDHVALTSLVIDSANTTGSFCLIGSLSCSVIDTSMFSCSSLPTDCAASVVMSAELPMRVVAGNNITLETTLQYDSSPFSTPHTGVMYTPLEVSVHVYYFTMAYVNAWQSL